MGKKVTFTRKQMEHIMECNGIPQEKYDEILEATTCGSVGGQVLKPNCFGGDKNFWFPTVKQKGASKIKHKKHE